MSSAADADEPVVRRPGRGGGKRVIDDEDDEVEDTSVLEPSEMLRQLAMIARDVVGSETVQRLSPERTHRIPSVSMATTREDDGSTTVLASFHGNLVRARPGPVAVEATLDVGDCWNADEREALARLVYVFFSSGTNMVRLRIRILPRPRVGPHGSTRPATVASVRAYLGGVFRHAERDGDDAVVVRNEDDPDTERVMRILDVTHQIRKTDRNVLTAEQARRLDVDLAGTLKIFKVYSSRMANFLVSPYSGATDKMRADTVRDELESYHEFVAKDTVGESRRYFLVALDFLGGSVVCVAVNPVVGGDAFVDPALPASQTYCRKIGSYETAYMFGVHWPAQADSLVRRIRYSVEIVAFYEGRAGTGVARRVLGILLALASDAVLEGQIHPDVWNEVQREKLTEDQIVVAVYANGSGVPTIAPAEFDRRVPADQRRFSVVKPGDPGPDVGQLGLRRLYASLGLEPIAAASDTPGKKAKAPTLISDVYSASYLFPAFVADNPRAARDADSVHVGSLAHVRQALGVRYAGEPIDTDQFKARVTELSKLGYRSLGRIDHDAFLVLGYTAYAPGKDPVHEASVHPSVSRRIKRLDLSPLYDGLGLPPPSAAPPAPVITVGTPAPVGPTIMPSFT